MLPTKGYFQDIECPYFNSLCGRPYCHFRHRKKHSEQIEEVIAESEKETAQVIPTYKPTPKSQLASIQNSRSHIPISYVPDLAFRTDKKLRYTPKIENPVYKPTPLSILSSANKSNQSLNEENKEQQEVINEIKQNIANVEYDPTIPLQNVRDIDFEDLSNEFELIDELINSNDKNQNVSETELHEENGVTFEASENIVHQKNADSKELENEENAEDDHTEKVLNDNSNETEKTSSTQMKHSDSSEKKYSEDITLPRKYKDDSKSKGAGRNAEEKGRRHKKESSDHKKNKRKERSKSPNSEKAKNKSKSTSKDKNKNREKESLEKSKKDEVTKKNCSSKHKEKHKSKECDKPEKETSKSKNEKRHSSEKRDRSDHRKNRVKEKFDNKERTPSRSKEHANIRDKSDNREKSPNRKKEHKSSEENKKRKHSDKGKDRDKTEERSKSKKEKIRETDKKKTFIKISDSNENEFNFAEVNSFESDSDVDVNEDETMQECYRIFNEYNPTPKIEENITSYRLSEKSDISMNTEDNSEYLTKKRIAHSNVENSSHNLKYTYNKPKTVQTPGQILGNRYKIAKLAQANREQELLINEMHQPVAIKRPPPSLLEAARERKKLKEMEQHSQSSNLIDDILQGSTKTSSLMQKMMPKKIAPVQNVLAITRAKERISRIKPVAAPKTIAQTQKGSRVAHVPDISLSDIPDVLQADRSKLPVNVRTRFLTMIADECVKLYISKDEAYTRALKEEFTCYEKCKVLTSYRNSAMLAVNRLRKEVHERDKNGLGLIGIGEELGEGSGSETKASQFYNKIKHWILTEEELDIHGYPRQNDEHGVAIVKNFKSKYPTNLDENQRICSRCHKLYQVDDDGWTLYEEECCYHPMKKRTIRGEQTYLCCRSSDEMGCATSDTHVCDGFTSGRLEGFQTTMESDFEGDPRNSAVYALDCEMCYTTRGLELTRVTIVDTDCKTVYESFVKPLNPIIDYNTKFSGITKEQMDRTSTSILQVQANILHLCNSRTILVGHSLESDMKALKIVHSKIVDTSVLFPHKMGLPHKRALRALASEYLRKIIQNDVNGHDSAEDAVTCMELLKWKLKEEAKGKPSK